MNKIVNIIPAAPDFWVLVEMIDPASKLSYWKYPIVAWRVETERSGSECHSDVVPICIEPNVSTDSPILCPDGRVEIRGDRSFSSVAAWLKYCNEKTGSVLVS